MAALAEVCDIVIGRTPPRAESRYWGGDHPWLSIADMGQSRQIRSTKESISDEGAKLFRGRQVQPGTVLLSFKLSVGKVGVADVPLYTNEAIAALPIRDLSRLSPDFLAHYLAFADLTAGTDRAAMGKTLNLPKLRAIEIPLPPLPEQRRIASILDEAEALQRARRDAIESLQNLIDARFMSQFSAHRGDTSLKKLRDITTIRSGSTPDRSRPEFYGGGTPWVKTTEVRGDLILKTEETVSELGIASARLKTYPRGSILVAMYGQGKTRGQSAVLGIEATVNQACAVVLPSKEFLTGFMAHQLRLSYDLLRSKAQGGNQANLNLGLVGDLDVAVPPLKDQADFQRFVEVAETVLTLHREQLAKLDELFASLQHRAFRGEL